MHEIKCQASPIDAVLIGPHISVCTTFCSSQARSEDQGFGIFAQCASPNIQAVDLGPPLSESFGTLRLTNYLEICTIAIFFMWATRLGQVGKEATDLAWDFPQNV